MRGNIMHARFEGPGARLATIVSHSVLIRLKKMVLPDRIELSTSPLPMECSTTELRQHAGARESAIAVPPGGRSLPQGHRPRKRGTARGSISVWGWGGGSGRGHG